ncbi:hypothetical protein SAMN06272741_1939 [Streptomyces sp. 2114.4]|nr:hypothetical protein SAMN06272741_1939 [Streptomyces sp. 2114.4]
MALPAPQGRRSSTYTRLLRHGFTDPSAAGELLDAPELASVRDDSVLLEALGATADPDLALHSLVRLVEAQEGDEQQTLLSTIVAAKPLRDRLLGVLGASEALADHLVRHPRDWQSLVTYESVDLHPTTPSSSWRSPRGSGAERTPNGPAPTRCAPPTAAPCWASPPATSVARPMSPRPRPSWRTWPPPRSGPPWRSATRRRPATPRCAGWPSSAWANAAAGS